jgi:hypothetical protein
MVTQNTGLSLICSEQNIKKALHRILDNLWQVTSYPKYRLILDMPVQNIKKALHQIFDNLWSVNSYPKYRQILDMLCPKHQKSTTPDL